MKRFTLFLIILFLGFVQICDAQYYYNRAISLDGNNANYVSVPPPSANLNITGSFTLECWLKPNNITGAQMIIKKGDDVGNLTGYALLMDAGRVRIRTNGSTRLTGTTAIPIGVWSHFAGTYNSATNTFTAYVNGVASGTAVVASALPLSNANDSVLFGRGFNSPYNGQIDEIRIWNVTRTLAEIQATMRLPLGEAGAQYPGLVGSWRANNPAGGSGAEEISGHNAVLRGAAAYVLVGDKPGGYLAYNTGVTFSGVAGTYFAAPHAAPLNITGSFTLECWVNPMNVASPSFQIVIQKRQGSTSSGYTMYLSTGKVSVRTNSSTRLTGTTTIPNGVWSHIAATYNSSTNVFTVYVNGNPDGTATVAGAAPAADTDSLRLASGFNSPYAGLMDEVRITNYAKTTEEIQRGLFVSIDANNEPNPGSTNISYSFEGTLHGTDGSSRGRFNGAAAFTQVFNNATQFPSPLDRFDAGSFANGFRVRYANLTFGAAPTTITDSIFMPQSLTISDVNVFVAALHTYANDISVSLRNPANSTTRILYPGAGPDLGMHMITVFDDQADSTIGGTVRAPWSPRVKPTNNLAIFNTQNSSGWWKLILTDIFPGADNGRLMGWGIQFNNQTITGSEQGGIVEVPVRFNLYQNYPNPFNPTTTIKYDIAREVDVKIVIYDILGKEVQTLVDEHKKAGSYTILANFGNLASGIYMYKIKAGDFVDVRKMILVK
jgi:subtilisin-like proprotein convertase family protein